MTRTVLLLSWWKEGNSVSRYSELRQMRLLSFLKKTFLFNTIALLLLSIKVPSLSVNGCLRFIWWWKKCILVYTTVFSTKHFWTRGIPRLLIWSVTLTYVSVHLTGVLVHYPLIPLPALCWNPVGLSRESQTSPESLCDYELCGSLCPCCNLMAGRRAAAWHTRGLLKMNGTFTVPLDSVWTQASCLQPRHRIQKANFSKNKRIWEAVSLNALIKD